MARRPVNPELIEAVRRHAPTIGLDPKDLLGIYSYETGGTLDPWQPGPTTKWGQHRGLIQWGEPQARKYGVTATTPVDQQVAASLKYLQDRGFKPGMGLPEAYAAVNAGGVTPKHMQMRDAAAGGAPGTVLDKVNKQMGPHLAKAEALLGGKEGTVAAPQVASNIAKAPSDPGLPNVTQLPTTGLLGPAPDPFAAALAEREKEQQAQQLAQAVQQAKVAPPPSSPPPEPVPAAPPVDYSSLLMPRLRRGLLADPGYGLLT